METRCRQRLRPERLSRGEGNKASNCELVEGKGRRSKLDLVVLSQSDIAYWLLSLVVHSDYWLLAVAFYHGALLNSYERYFMYCFQ
ncbi:hypothetical protein R6Q59_026516 [Mikania micrantha]